MGIYTKNGDNGITSLMNTANISKSDDRIQLLGNLDELSCNIGLVKVSFGKEDIRRKLQHIQETLMTIMAGIADQYNREYKLKENEIEDLEQEIDRLEGLFPREKAFIIPGKNKLSAQIDIARTVARRAERWMCSVAKKYTIDPGARRYLNRLSDYMYIVARYAEFLYGEDNPHKISNDLPNYRMEEADARMTTENFNRSNIADSNQINADNSVNNLPNSKLSKDALVNAVMDKLAIGHTRINLDEAKRLIGKVEEFAKGMNVNAVISICNPEGNPVAVHVMDGAFLASFDISMKKAYTSVALKMSTKMLGKLATPGGPLYGIDKADNGRIIIFGGGVPLTVNDRIIGGLGVSGGSAEEDSKIAEYGFTILQEILER